MSKFAAAILLIALGLGIGLWLGYDPEARAATQDNLARANSSMAQIKSDIALKLGTAKPAPDTQSTDSAESQKGVSPLSGIPAVMKDLWTATQQLWVSLLARIEAAL